MPTAYALLKAKTRSFGDEELSFGASGDFWYDHGMYYVHSSRLKRLADAARANHWDDDAFNHVLHATDEELLAPTQTFSVDHFIQVFRAVLARTRDSCFGLHMGQDSTLGGSIGMMCASCATLKDAFEQGSAYFHMMGNITKFEFLHEPPHYVMRLQLLGSWSRTAPEVAMHEVDAMFSFFTGIVSLNSHRMIRPTAVLLQRETLIRPMEYEKIFGVQPQTGRQYNEIRYDEQDMQTPMKAFNQDIFRLLKNHLEQSMNTQRSTTSAKVQSLLLAQLNYHFPDIQQMADMLCMSSRSLQRKLKEEGTSFKDILQKVKCDLAERLLQNSELSVSEIAYTLGYSDDSNFSRAFKKSTGVSPGEYRERQTSH